jgi:hypothetical protein
MPQLIALAIAGAGLYAGYRWVSRKLAAERAAATAEAERRARPADGEPRDLGRLAWDEAARAYRPENRP